MNEQTENTATKPKKKGTGGFFHLFLIIPYGCIILTILLLIYSIFELFGVFAVASGLVLMQLGLLFAILAFVSRMYYKMFKRD